MSEKQLVSQLSALGEALRSADVGKAGSFAAVFNAFFDIAQGPDLMRLSKVESRSELQATLERTSRQLLGDETAVLNGLRMFGCAAGDFVHGCFFVGRTVGTFFFFTKNKQGLVAFNSGTPRTDYSRITTTDLPSGTTPMRGPRGEA
ncbi:MAG: hypothetical protein R3B70_16090 [Polyangiaceae bacterium]